MVKFRILMLPCFCTTFMALYVQRKLNNGQRIIVDSATMHVQNIAIHKYSLLELLETIFAAVRKLQSLNAKPCNKPAIATHDP